MAGSKKRKEPAQSSTLHDFFGSSSVKKSRCGTPALKATATERVATHHAIKSEDTIIISDDEEDCPKDERQGQSLSTSTRDAAIELKPASLVFEMPTLLESTTFKHQAVEGRPHINDHFEDLSTDDPGTTDDIIPLNNESQDPQPQRYGDWATGDDENISMPEEEEEEEEDTAFGDAKVELCQGQYSNVEYVCPVCGRDLQGLFNTEADRHVNSCIDALSGTPPPIQVEISQYEPLSSVQPPSAPTSASTSLKKVASAFSVLMSSHKENDAWKEASEAENKKGNSRARRPAPFYKVMQGMPIAVDAFRYGKIPGVTAYFLTHAHSDHYTNLSSSWKHGPIYCSQTTANLIVHMLDVDPKWVFPLPMNNSTVVPNTGEVEVTLIQANHCPGSVLFLFKGRQTVNAGDSTFTSPYVGSEHIFRYLHCGDFRACPQHVLHSEIKGYKIDTVYLDTTYLDPKYCFPPQPQVISACAELACRIVHGSNMPGQTVKNDEQPAKGLMTNWLTVPEKGKDKEPVERRDERVLVVVGTYTIGKERIVKAIAKALSTKVFCDARKTAVLRCLSDPELHAMLTSDPYEAGVHVVPLHMINSEKFQDYLSQWKGHWTKAVGFRPTGWTYTPPSGVDTLPSIPYIISRDQARNFTHANLRPMRNSTPSLMLYGVPYSEHSSFFELTCFALSLDWGKMIATVNVGSAKSRGKMAKWFEKWQAERRKGDKSGGEVVKYRQPDYW